MRNYFLYIRVAVQDEHHADTQKNHIKQYMKNNLKLSDTEIDNLTFYEDINTSGLTPLAERKGFGQLMEDIINSHNTNCHIITYDIARITRSLDMSYELEKFINKYCIQLHYSAYNGPIKV